MTYDYRIGNFSYSGGTGTLAATLGVAAVTGSGTAFTTQLQEGGVIVCNGYTLAIETITDNTHLTLQSVAPASFSGQAFTYNNLTNVKNLAGSPSAPRSTFKPWVDAVDLGNGLRRGVGRPLAGWQWGFLTRQQRDALWAYVLGASTRLYVRTKINQNTTGYADKYQTYLAALLWPDSEDVQAGRYLNFTLTFRDLVLL